MRRLAHSTEAALLGELPLALLLMRPTEREKFVLLRARMRQPRIGTCERALARLGRRLDEMSRWYR